jgi:hypothetical protein
LLDLFQPGEVELNAIEANGGHFVAEHAKAQVKQERAEAGGIVIAEGSVNATRG